MVQNNDGYLNFIKNAPPAPLLNFDLSSIYTVCPGAHTLSKMVVLEDKIKTISAKRRL